MEENARRDRERPDDSDLESNGAMLPLLQPPGNQQSHRITNFYIDNILRPDFGRKRKDGTLVREADSLGVIIRREELPGRKSSKTGNPQQGGAGGKEEEKTGASDDRRPDTEDRRPDLIASDVAVKGRGSGGERCRSPQASSAPAAKPMLWPAWVYCTRYSDRPSSGWWKLFSHLSLIERKIWINTRRPVRILHFWVSWKKAWIALNSSLFQKEKKSYDWMIFEFKTSETNSFEKKERVAFYSLSSATPDPLNRHITCNNWQTNYCSTITNIYSNVISNSFIISYFQCFKDDRFLE